MTFLIPSPWAVSEPPIEGELTLTEESVPLVLERAAALLARMRQDAVAARAVAAAALGRLEDAAATISTAERNLETAGPVAAKAAAEFRRAGDERQAHWAATRLQAARNALRVAEDAARDCMAAHAAIEREGAIAKRRADVLAERIAAAELAAERLVLAVDAPDGPVA